MNNLAIEIPCNPVQEIQNKNSEDNTKWVGRTVQRTPIYFHSALPLEIWLHIIGYLGIGEDKKFSSFYYKIFDKKTNKPTIIKIEDIDKRAPFPGWMILEALKNKQFDKALVLLQNQHIEYTSLQIDHLWNHCIESKIESKNRFINLISQQSTLTTDEIDFINTSFFNTSFVKGFQTSLIMEELSLPHLHLQQELLAPPLNSLFQDKQKHVSGALRDTLFNPLPTDVRKAIIDVMSKFIKKDKDGLNKELSPLIKQTVSLLNDDESAISYIDKIDSSLLTMQNNNDDVLYQLIHFFSLSTFLGNEKLVIKCIDKFRQITSIIPKNKQLQRKYQYYSDSLTNACFEALDIACVQGHMEIVKQYFSNTENKSFFEYKWFASSLVDSPFYRDTILAKTCKAGQINVTKFLLADSRADKPFRESAFKYIAESNDLNLFNVFHESGKLDATEYSSLFESACDKNNLPLIKKMMDDALVTHQMISSCFIKACSTPNQHSVALCIVQHKRFFPIEKYDSNFRVACTIPETDVAKEIIKIRDSNYYFRMAVKRGSDRTFDKLITMGYEPPTNLWEFFAYGLHEKVMNMAQDNPDSKAAKYITNTLALIPKETDARDKIDIILSEPIIDLLHDDDPCNNLEGNLWQEKFESFYNYMNIYKKLVKLPQLTHLYPNERPIPWKDYILPDEEFKKLPDEEFKKLIEELEQLNEEN